MMQDFFNFFNSFPSEEHVTKVCLFPIGGEKICRFFTTASKGFGCCKFKANKHSVEEQTVNGDRLFKGNNCHGLIGHIVKNQKKLINLRIGLGRQGFSLKPIGLFRKMIMENGAVQIITDLDNKEMFPLFSIKDLTISVEQRGLILGMSDKFIKEKTVILFN